MAVGGRGAHAPRRSRLDPASGRHRSTASHPDWWEPHLVCSLEEVQRPHLEPFFWNTNNSHFRNFSLKGKSNNTTFPTFLHFLSLTLVIYLWHLTLLRPRLWGLSFPWVRSSEAQRSLPREAVCTSARRPWPTPSRETWLPFLQWGASVLACLCCRTGWNGQVHTLPTTWKRLQSIKLLAWAYAMIGKDCGIVRIRKRS